MPAEDEDLVESFLAIQRKLGTLEHGVALAELSRQYVKARHEAGDEWRSIWRSFRRKRTKALEGKRELGSIESELESHACETEDFLATLDPNDELAKSLRNTIDAMKEVIAPENRTSRQLWRFPWLLLWADLRIYFEYVRYFVVRFSVFALRHGFIILVLVLIFGIGYSQLTAFLTRAASGWVVAALVFGAAMFKRYCLDPRLTKLLISLESRWLAKIASRLFVLRTYARAARKHPRTLDV